MNILDKLNKNKIFKKISTFCKKCICLMIEIIKKISHTPPEYFWPFIYLIIILLLLLNLPSLPHYWSCLFNFKCIDKSLLDTFIVILSLASLILNNLLKFHNPEKLNNYISRILLGISYGILFIISGYIIILCFILFTAYSWLRDEVLNNICSILFVSLKLIGISFLLRVLSKIAEKEEHLFYALWWSFILVLYLIKIF